MKERLLPLPLSHWYYFKEGKKLTNVVDVLFQVCVELWVNGNIAFMHVVHTLLCMREVDVVEAGAHICTLVFLQTNEADVKVGVDVGTDALAGARRFNGLPSHPHC